MKRLFGKVDITGGPLFASMVRYCIPVMIAGVIQVLFNAVDIAVLGNMAGTDAVASVGVTSPIVSLLVTSFTGLGVGVTVLLARYLGGGEHELVRRTISTAVITAVSLGVLIAVAGILLGYPMLDLVNCPSQNEKDAFLYLVIYFAGAPAILLYSFSSAILRVNGDTVRPLLYILLSGLLNVGLNVVLCLLLERKVAAVAIATLASQMLGAVLGLLRLHKLNDEFRFSFSRLCFDFGIFKKLLRYGLPAAINSSLYSISNIQISSILNSYGADAIAGNTAASSIESIINAVITAYTGAITVFVGQNLGAEKHDRVKKSILYGLFAAVTIAVVLGDGAYLLRESLLGLYVPGQDAAIGFGALRMTYVCAILFVAAINSTLGHALQAFGYSSASATISIGTVLVFRFAWMLAIYPYFETIHCLYFCYSCSWSLNLLVATIVFFLIWRRYKRGKLRKI